MRWISNTPEAAATMLEPLTGGGWQFGAVSIEADFEISSESLAPYVVAIFVALAPLELLEIPVALISIRGGCVRIF